MAHRRTARGRAAGGPGDRQPRLATAFRRGDRADAQRFRRAGPAAGASGTARFSGRRARRGGLAAQAAAQADRDERRLSPASHVSGRAGRDRSGCPLLLSPPGAPVRRSAARFDPGGQRPARSHAVRSGGQALLASRGSVRPGERQPRAPGSDGPEQWRRSIYLFVKRSLPTPLLETFDAPVPSSSCGRRMQSTVPTQALALLNDPFVRRSGPVLRRALPGRGGCRAAGPDRLGVPIGAWARRRSRTNASCACGSWPHSRPKRRWSIFVTYFSG